MLRSTSLCATFALAACMSGDDGTRSDDPLTCEANPNYGDGNCDIDIGCGLTDIDCIVTFDSDEEAKAFVDRNSDEQVLTRPTLEARARMLTDQAWDHFKAAIPVGRLADHRPGVVVLDNLKVNAAAGEDHSAGKMAHLVMIHRGMLEKHGDAEIVGVLAHEFAHIWKLHGVYDATIGQPRFYIAPTLPEPVGATAQNNEQAMSYVREWQARAAILGTGLPYEEHDVPLDGMLGRILDRVTAEVKLEVPACAAALERLHAARKALRYSRVEMSFASTPDQRTELDAAITDAASCLGDESTLRSRMGNSEKDSFDMRLGDVTAEPLFDQPWLPALIALSAHERAELRAWEEAGEEELGAPWSAVRFFTSEEEADDLAARVAASAAPGTLALDEFLLKVLGDERAACEQLIADGAPVPYGRDLLDRHHGACWRVVHFRQLRDATGR